MMQMPIRRSAGDRDGSRSCPICGMIVSMRGITLSPYSLRIEVNALDS